MADVFISHIQDEAGVSQGLIEYLRTYKLSTFLSSDTGQIRSGERWFDRIADELNASKVVLLMLSKNSVARPWINFEAGWAWALKRATIPVCFGGLDKGQMPRPYSDLQGVNLRGGNAYRLVLDCYYHLKPAGTAPPPLHGDNEERLQKRLDELEGPKRSLRRI